MKQTKSVIFFSLLIFCIGGTAALGSQEKRGSCPCSWRSGHRGCHALPSRLRSAAPAHHWMFLFPYHILRSCWIPIALRFPESCLWYHSFFVYVPSFSIPLRPPLCLCVLRGNVTPVSRLIALGKRTFPRRTQRNGGARRGKFNMYLLNYSSPFSSVSPCPLCET